MNTAVAILAGVIFGNEPFTIGMAIGLPLVTIGSYLASQRGKQSKPSSTSEDS
jgi:drug/metabolite transporter (DMT)-like permease